MSAGSLALPLGPGRIGVVVLLLIFPAWAGAAATPPISVSQKLDEAATLLSLGRATPAMTLLDEVVEMEPGNPWIWFYRGVGRTQLGEPYRAIDSFDRAKEILESLGNPDTDLAERIRRHRTKARQKVLRLTLKTGLAHDTNVTYLGEGAAVGLAEISGKADAKFGSGLDVVYAPVADSQQTLEFGLRLGHTWHFSVEQFNYQDYGGHVRYVRQLDDHWRAGLRYDYDFTLLGNDAFLSNHAITPNLTYSWHEAIGPLTLKETEAYYQIALRDFLYETLPHFNRDGPAQAFGIEQRMSLVVSEQWAWDIAGGYQFAAFLTDGREFDRITHDFYLGLDIPLINPANPHEYLLLPDLPLLFEFDVDWQLADYRNRSRIDRNRSHRRDYIFTASWAVSQKLLEDPDLGDLTLQTFIQWTDADSNVETSQRFRGTGAPFTYDKLLTGMQLVWTW